MTNEIFLWLNSNLELVQDEFFLKQKRISLKSWYDLTDPTDYDEISYLSLKFDST